MTKREECRILSSDPSIPAVGFGHYVDGYDSGRESKPIGKTIIFGILALVFLFEAVKMAFHPEILELGFVLAFLIPGTGLAFLFLALRPWIRFRNRVYVFDDGFVWTKERKDGKVVKKEEYDLNKIDGIKFSRTSRYLNGRVYSGTDYYFEIITNQEVVFKKSGSYTIPDDGGWVYFALQSIMQQWMKIGLKRMNEELQTNGFLRFDDIVLSNEFIRRGNTEVLREDLRYTFEGSSLLIDRASKKKIMNLTHDIVVDVNDLMNGQLFLVAVKNLLGIG